MLYDSSAENGDHALSTKAWTFDYSVSISTDSSSFESINNLDVPYISFDLSHPKISIHSLDLSDIGVY